MEIEYEIPQKEIIVPDEFNIKSNGNITMYLVKKDYNRFDRYDLFRSEDGRQINYYSKSEIVRNLRDRTWRIIKT